MRTLTFILVNILLAHVTGNVLTKDEGSGEKKVLHKRKIQTLSHNYESLRRKGKEISKNWPFLPENFPSPLGVSGPPKPFGPFPFNARPKPGPNNNPPPPNQSLSPHPESQPLSPPLPVWGWEGDKGGWTSVGWISVEPSSSTCTVPSETVTVTSTSVFTSTSVLTDTVSPTGSDGTEWSQPTDVVTSTEWQTAITTQEITTTSTILETSTIEETSTKVETSTSTATYTIVNTQTPTTTVTSTEYETETITSTSTASAGWTAFSATQSIVLEPSVAVEYTTSTVTLFITETPTITTHIPKETTITTGLEVVVETVYSSLTTPSQPIVAETVYIATSSDVIVDTVTSTVSTNQPQCTLTEYEYLATLTTPTLTHTATTCGIPCGPGEKCVPVCYPKTATKYIDVTSTSIVTATQPLLITLSATETKTEYNVTPTVAYTTTTLEVIDEPQETTITATSTVGTASIQTVTTEVTLSSLPTTLTTRENLCTVTILETCTSTMTLEPVTMTIYDTSLVEVDETVFMETTSFIAPSIPTETSYVQGDIGTTTATIVETVVTNSDPTTVTITSGTTTEGYGETTITPTKTILRKQTATFTSTPVLSTTYIRKRTLKVEEHTTKVEETTEYYHVTPSITDVEVVEVTPTPSVVVETNLLVHAPSPSSSAPSGGWGHQFPPKRPMFSRF